VFVLPVEKDGRLSSIDSGKEIVVKIFTTVEDYEAEVNGLSLAQQLQPTSARILVPQLFVHGKLFPRQELSYEIPEDEEEDEDDDEEVGAPERDRDETVS